MIPTPIKTLGDFKVEAKLFTDVEATFTAKVVMDQNQAEENRKKQALAEKRAAAKKKKEAEAPATEEAAPAEEETTEA